MNHKNYTVKFQSAAGKYCPTSDPELVRTQTGMTIHEARREAKRLNEQIPAQPTNTDPLEGLNELRTAQDIAYNEEHRYNSEFEAMMSDDGNDGTNPPAPLNEQLRQNANVLAAQYPRAAMYLRAENYSYSNSVYQYSAGIKAMELIANGGSLDEARDILNNWLPKEAIWD